MASEHVLVEVPIGAPIATVWAAVREPDGIAGWFGWDADSLAEEIRYIFVDHAVADEADHTLQFGEWQGVADRFELVQTGKGTLMRVVRSGGAAPGEDAAYDDVAEGWITFVQQLRLLLERHPSEKRRTIYLSGAAKPGISEPRAALGLTAAIAAPAGTTLSTRLPVDEASLGEVWHQSRFQTGVAVDAYGPGLLVVSDMGVSDKRPNGGGSVIVTTFGLTDGAFEALERQWTDWWTDRYTTPT